MPGTLDLCRKALGDAGLGEALASAWEAEQEAQEEAQRLQALRLDSCKLALAHASLAPQLLNFAALRELHLGFNKIDAGGCMNLAKVIAGLQLLETLVLDHNTSIGDEGMMALADGIAKSRSLAVVSLTKCRIGDQGIISLVSALLDSSCPIHELTLSHNRFGEEGVESIWQLVRSSPTLHTLRLRSCGLISADVALLAEVLSSNVTTLKCLDLRSNAIGDLGLGHIVSGLSGPQHSLLEQLDVQSNKITGDALPSLRDCLFSNDALHNLNLQRNALADLQEEAVVETLRHIVCLLGKNRELSALRAQLAQGGDAASRAPEPTTAQGQEQDNSAVDAADETAEADRAPGLGARTEAAPETPVPPPPPATAGPLLFLLGALAGAGAAALFVCAKRR